MNPIKHLLPGFLEFNCTFIALSEWPYTEIGSGLYVIMELSIIQI